jgi:hypothetical protein
MTNLRFPRRMKVTVSGPFLPALLIYNHLEAEKISE